jgi:hypothetical protein
MSHKYFHLKAWMLLGIVTLCFATAARAQEGQQNGQEDDPFRMKGASLGPELLLGSAFPQFSPTPQPITAVQVGVRGYYPIASDFAARLSASYRYLQIWGEPASAPFEFTGNYFFFAPALRYKFLELGVDVGTPLGGFFKTHGGSFVDTASNLGSSDMAMLVLGSLTGILPIARGETSELSLILEWSFQFTEKVMVKQFILRSISSSNLSGTNSGDLGPIETVQVGLSWQFGFAHRNDDDGWR